MLERQICEKNFSKSFTPFCCLKHDSWTSQDYRNWQKLYKCLTNNYFRKIYNNIDRHINGLIQRESQVMKIKQVQTLYRRSVGSGSVDMEIMVDLGILVLRKFWSSQKNFREITPILSQEWSFGKKLLLFYRKNEMLVKIKAIFIAEMECCWK